MIREIIDKGAVESHKVRKRERERERVCVCVFQQRNKKSYR